MKECPFVKYVIAGGLDSEALEKNINFYAERGYKVIPPIFVEKGKHFRAYIVLMELQDSGGTQ